MREMVEQSHQIAELVGLLIVQQQSLLHQQIDEICIERLLSDCICTVSENIGVYVFLVQNKGDHFAYLFEFKLVSYLGRQHVFLI